MLISHDREKLINAIVYFLTNTRNCGIAKLCKLLYYLDFLHFRETGRSVTGLSYYAWDFGPVPQELYMEVRNNPLPDLRESVYFAFNKGKSFAPMRAGKSFDDKHFSKRELRILEDVAFIFKDTTAEDISEASHLPNHPWDETIKTKGLKGEISYTLAIDESERSISLEEALERISDSEVIKKAFSGKRI
ncbi:Panacea domain-containing protein [Candidatus Magnetobacterium casense]|uniref:SocA family protein n=1 Tax=Candidatus Magnetobacterium casense TaxID=1455061 RepID=A0ABS6RZJ9_9BACT|nr:Panacea domain-containing protein [Candidatus Magnetobacterium casensis]MBV6341499.1 SocA family protein [Candidatus Magnetobacterium casensis]